MANNNHFNLTLDTLAPSGSITRPAEYLRNNSSSVTIVKGDATEMKVWFDGNPNSTKTSAGYTDASWEAAATSKQTAFTTSGTYYYHLVLRDDVNNESAVFHSAAIVFDKDAPVISSFYAEDPNTHSHAIITTRSNIPYQVVFSDATSGPATLEITSPALAVPIVDNNPVSPKSSTFDISPSFVGTSVTLTVTITDRAGNSKSETCTFTLDTGAGQPILSLAHGQTSIISSGWYNLKWGGSIEDRVIDATATCSDTDLVAYKIWEDGQTEPEWTTQTKGALNVTEQITISANDGLKTINAQVKDEGGNVSTVATFSFYVDTVAPVVTITTNKNLISNVSGYNTATLTLSAIDNNGSGIASYVLETVGTPGTTIDSGTSVPASADVTSLSGGFVEGSNTVRLTVTDVAGNSASATVAIVLDTTVPTVSIGTLNTWYTAQFAPTVTFSDTNGVHHLEAWASTVPNDTTGSVTTIVPDASGTQAVTLNPFTVSDGATNNYVHVKAVDNAGNVSYAHAQFGYDATAPVVTASFSQAAYQSVSAEINISSTETGSGNYQMRLTGTGLAAQGTWVPFATPVSVTLSSGDGTKIVNVEVKDVAGNTSVAATCSCELDTTDPSGTVIIYERDGSITKPANSPEPKFALRITAVDIPPAGDTDPDDRIWYKIYGDFTVGDTQQAQGISEQDAQWVLYEPDTGKDYKLVTGLVATQGDGTKTVYLKVKDSADRTHQSSSLFYLDMTAPEVVVSDVDYNRISKVHVLRRNNGGDIADKYADETHFTFTPDDYIIAYKVCAYASQADAEHGSHDDDAIPSTAGSVNMSATGISSIAAVSCMIKGADLETAVSGDGLKIIVVYVQDKAGTWSAAANFAA